MKTQLALLGCLVFAWNIASAQVNCAQAPYGESIAQFGRDEFHLGMMAAAHHDDRPSIRPALLRKLERAMRAACRAKFHGRDLARYAKLGFSPHSLATRSVGAIAALTVQWNSPSGPGSDRIAPPPRLSGRLPATARGTASGSLRHPPPSANGQSVAVKSSFPACPRRVDIQALLTAALIDKSDWTKAEAKGRRHGCIELGAGERVYRLRSEAWSGLIEVRPQGRTRTYWTDAVAVK
jgi:hypothetical protein